MIPAFVVNAVTLAGLIAMMLGMGFKVTLGMWPHRSCSPAWS